MNENEVLGKYECITPKLAQESGVSKHQFYKYVKENELEQICRGVYAAKDNWVDELYILHNRYPSAVFSHDEAFYYHGLTDREPLVHTLTMYSGFNAHPLVGDGGNKVYYVKRELLDIGKTIVADNYGNEIPVYDMERTICDLIRNRNMIEQQEFNTVLKSYVSRKDKNINRLMEYADLFKLKNVVRKYMEVLL